MATDPKATIEGMVTAVISNDPTVQALVVDRLTAGEESFCRAAAEIIAGIFIALGKMSDRGPADLWAEQMAIVSGRRVSRG
jgi:hypothetical protein